ncbi:hypothetical protein IC762_17795 [Bradyrhizobium genosp. L]|uniref:hypothetical protein n=1 Tax=Bradyrhizobium genosp. L TaxID=83637 RepID=UPI0018A28A07|nr:hypothetical protein [Bradyrhizobium genosp. L]QPF88424.1 hypothetical protein IC762_17795 [Bradyrhizobium genosp. L]
MRKTEIVKATHGRDANKHFQITEWPAEAADRWATRVLLAMTRGSKPIHIPVESLLGRGMEAIFVVGLQTILSASVDTNEVLPLIDELLDCVQIVRDPVARDKTTGGPVASPVVAMSGDIEEVQTRWWLRSEVLRIHTGFSAADMFGTLLSSILSPTGPNSGNMPTSAASSAP